MAKEDILDESIQILCILQDYKVRVLLFSKVLNYILKKQIFSKTRYLDIAFMLHLYLRFL